MLCLIRIRYSLSCHVFTETLMGFRSCSRAMSTISLNTGSSSWKYGTTPSGSQSKTLLSWFNGFYSRLFGVWHCCSRCLDAVTVAREILVAWLNRLSYKFSAFEIISLGLACSAYLTWGYWRTSSLFTLSPICAFRSGVEECIQEPN